MEKDHPEDLPTYTDAVRVRPWIYRRPKRRTVRLLAIACIAYFAFSTYKIASNTAKPSTNLLIERLHQDYATCASLKRNPAAKTSEKPRNYNKRWVNSTRPLLIRNATVWTGEPAAGTSDDDARLGKGYAWVRSDVFVDHGLIKKIRPVYNIDDLPRHTEIFDAHGRQLTAGIVDMHSHAGLGSVGNLQDDVNELSSDITPYVRSLDGLDPLQPEIQFIKSGGVTASLILPGSGNNMGGEAFVVKFAVGKQNGRAEISTQDMIADPDKNWRYMKMACGENPKRVYGKVGERGPFSRLGESWEFRHALEQARDYVRSQDEWCAAAESLGAERMTTYLPQELRWESLGAVLRGQVRVNTHCYTIPDLEAFVEHTNEFRFRVYAFHHAHQTYLVPEILKRAWGGAPAAALFADNMYYKVEAYTASEKAGKILYENNITPTYVSDNPVLNSQHVVFEAAKAYGYGLPYHAALAGVTSAPAELLGLGDQFGKIKETFDADIVLWDSDPLSVGATPVQVWIDGAAQFQDPVVLEKPESKPITPNPLLGKDVEVRELGGSAVFTGISRVFLGPNTNTTFLPREDLPAVAIIVGGALSCVGSCQDELAVAHASHIPVFALQNGYITPPFTSFGSSLGLIEIDAESDTQDGPPPKDGNGIARAIDGLQFGGKQLARAFEHGVTNAITAPSTGSIDARGISVGFRTNAKNVLQKDAVFDEEVAIHYVLSLGAKSEMGSISNALGELRGKLLEAVNGNSATVGAGADNTGPKTKDHYTEKAYLKRVVSGTLPLVLSAHSADTIASIIRLKTEIEAAIAMTLSTATPQPSPSPKLNFIILGASESHLLARELAAEQISIVLAPLLPHAQSWDQRRGLTGAPLTNGTVIDSLVKAGVLVGIGVEEVWETRDLGLLAGIAYANGEGRLGEQDALNLVGANFERMLRKGRGSGEERRRKWREEWLVWEGSPLEIGGRVRAVGGVESGNAPEIAFVHSLHFFAAPIVLTSPASRARLQVTMSSETSHFNAIQAETTFLQDFDPDHKVQKASLDIPLLWTGQSPFQKTTDDELRGKLETAVSRKGMGDKVHYADPDDRMYSVPKLNVNHVKLWYHSQPKEGARLSMAVDIRGHGCELIMPNQILDHEYPYDAQSRGDTTANITFKDTLVEMHVDHGVDVLTYNGDGHKLWVCYPPTAPNIRTLSKVDVHRYATL
ncbi:hypothetical protein BCR34DRAFT_593207 [Clohesyomyces aquaticus]|uniref:Amidohydrolase 3 domain-containing protein n=1 Tax=Clohesyomyces aquaticus TaxID=1231657 RepID=A0A1Y1YKU9_9PLEO|nr:hypothetical protein BCR34DRAFT_593207 [Clohesyomyces aquaticus]